VNYLTKCNCELCDITMICWFNDVVFDDGAI